ncbi:MAG TPA: cupin domain-containing protein [Candidatus Acidoferrum sp.]|jgi:quercetin dioxygenase-like cupin family protein
MDEAKMQAKHELAGAEVVSFPDMVNLQEGSVVSRTLLKRGGGVVTLFAFDEGQALSEHTTIFDAVVEVLEGEAEIRILGKPSVVKAGEAILLPSNQPHAVRAISKFKMLLTMIRP